jgi:NADPH-dependent 2,4-dienoyl-CoA reductase/sulfur reductase-like enzyme/rhodanese-related sulfurtransferase
MKRIVIIGGVAAGASAAAKARRTSEEVEITLVERGPYISFANCGLPYYVGGEIADRRKLFVTTAEQFSRRFRVDVRTNTRATAVDRDRRTVRVSGAEGADEDLPYDRLILATGTDPICPPIPGLDAENVFTCRTVPDVDAITRRLEVLTPPEREGVAEELQREAPLEAVVIGAGYIGLESAEQFRRRGFRVTVIELADQVMLALDAEMAVPLQRALTAAGCEVLLGDGLAKIVETDAGTAAVTRSGRRVPFDVAVVALGVRPASTLAGDAGLALGETGAVKVDAHQRTSDPHVFAAGDCTEATHLVTGAQVNIPLAGPANKAGRVAGANAVMDLEDAPDDDPRRLAFRGVLGTAIVRVFDTVAAVTGLTERQARDAGIDAKVLYMPGVSHAGYYPGAKPLLVKLLYAPSDGRILGAQVVGNEGVDKRIDVFATALSTGMTVEDLEQLDLAYAPPFGSARDVVIQAGHAASNERRGLMPAVTPTELQDELASDAPPVVVDTRSEREFREGHIEGAVNIPVDALRERIDEIPADGPVVLQCGTGYRSYVAERILMNAGRDNVRNLLGGFSLYSRMPEG